MPKTRRDTHAPIARSMSHFQRTAHDLLHEEGWEFVRRTGKGANTYQHPDGRRTNVIATPRNEGDALDYLKQAIKSPRQAIRPGTRELDTPPQKEEPVSTTMQDQMLNLASDWLRHPNPNASFSARRDRTAALAAWVERCLEQHGPMPTLTLEAAAAEMGYKPTQVAAARRAIGAKAWRDGSRAWIVGTAAQVPKHVAAYGRSEALEHPVGDNNGAGPEPREEPTGEINDRGFVNPLIAHDPMLDPVEPDTSPLTDAERAAVAMGGVIRDVPDDPRDELGDTPDDAWPPEVPFAPSETERARELYERPANPEVIAAVQMLMESVGVKPQDPGLLRLVAEADAALQVALGQLSELDSLLAQLKARLS